MKTDVVPSIKTRGQERVKRKFAWLPVTLSNNRKILWMFYKTLEVVEEGKSWDDDAYDGFGEMMKNGTYSWVVKKKYI